MGTVLTQALRNRGARSKNSMTKQVLEPEPKSIRIKTAEIRA